ncbi:MAG: chemotaxis-specific protein-glutamate methyltransferase CheB [Deltaproteobacteria bacterium]|nr:chemotaxis-specific protein-glutamate methyltransferase CheB [Deltaproteobacteria bacterium]
MQKIRVLVVDDSATVRKRLVDALGADPAFEVVAEAADGEVGWELCSLLHPDVVTLDMMMPRVDGLEATKRIMATCPTPIVIVSSRSQSEMRGALDALSAGAVDALDKPSSDDRAWDSRLRAVVRLIAGLKVIRRPRALQDLGPAPRDRREVEARDVVAIGASTGGPAAIAEILHALPASLNATVLVVVHIGPQFAPLLAEWLGHQTSIPVRVARDGERLSTSPARAEILLAPAEAHLTVRDGALAHDFGPEQHRCRPSVDVLFHSVAEALGPRAIGCLLTGMGRDGAQGLSAIRAAGGATIVQDEATSVVFGMPRAAIELGAADDVLPLLAIAPHIACLATRASHAVTRDRRGP